MTSDDPPLSAFDEFLDRLIRGEGVDPDAFLASHPDLPESDRDLLRRLCPGPDVGRLSPEREETTGALRAPDSPPVERVGAFRLGKRIGVGGMGAVFLADDESLGRRVAVKLLGPDLFGTGERDERFQREIRAAARLRHPNIVTVHAAGEQDGIRYLVMEFVPGSSLQEVLSDSTARGTRPPVGDVLRWGIGIARALHEAHEAGIIHRDVKPSNIRIAPDGHPVLLDFGIARDSGAATLTETGAFHGSPQYASPEQVGLAGTPIDLRTDVYSLGATLYEALTGVSPMRGETREQLFHHVLAREPVPLRRLDPSIPRDLETVVLAALEKDPRRRHQTAAALANDLEAVRDQKAVSVSPVSRLGRVARWAKRQPVKAALAAGLIVAVPLVAALGGYIAANLPRIRRASDEEQAGRLESLLEEAFLEYGEGDPERAQVVFEDAMKWDPRSEEAKAGFALSRLGLKDFEGTLAFLDQSGTGQEISPWRAQIRLEALNALGKKAEAGDVVARLPASPKLVRRPLDDFVIGVLGLSHFHGGNRNAAVDAFRLLRQAVLGTSPARALYHYELGHAAWHAGRHEDAREIARTIEQLWPESPERSFAVGRTLLDASPAEAFESLEKASDPLPRAHHVRDLIVSTLAESDRGPEVLARMLALAREGVALDPSRAKSHVLLGLVHVQTRETELAIQEFKEAIRLEPRLATAHRKLAECHEVKEAFGEALGPAREAVRLDPNDAKAWNVLGIALISRGQIDEAARDFAESVRLDPDSGHALCNLGRALGRQGKFTEGLDALRRGHAIGSKSPKWRYPSKKWIADTEKLVDLEKRLGALRGGDAQASSADEIAALAFKICRPKSLFAEASALYARAFEEEPALMTQRSPNYLLEAAASAAAAGLGKGADAPPGASERAALRERARTWLEDEIRESEELVKREPAEGASVASSLETWTRAPSLAAIRPDEAGLIAGIPAPEAAAWQSLWSRCAALGATASRPAVSR